MEPNLKAKENHAAKPGQPGQRGRRRTIVTIAATVASLAMGLGGLLTPFLSPSMAAAQQADRLCSLSGVPVTPLTTKKLIEQKEPCALPELSFQDAQGRALTLADFRGKVLLVNLWATWCPPCIKEMPALDGLQKVLGSDHFAVVAISQDRGGAAQAGGWLQSAGLENLALYVDPQSTVSRTLKAPGLPISLLIDEQGRELARLYGPAEWDSQDMIAAITRLAPSAADSR